MEITNYTNFDKINEFNVPNAKLEDFLYNVKLASVAHKKVILSYYKTFDQYVDLIDKKKHLFKVNDLSGDILNSERVVFNAIVYQRIDIETIQENVVAYCLSDFYVDIPDVIDIFGIQLKPISFIDKDAVKSALEKTITFDQILTIISELSKFKYEGEVNGVFIWSDKKQKMPQQNN
jgi:hypothetical protein